MEFLYLKLLFCLIFGVYIYRVSYYYDYKYIGNVIRFVTIYVLSNIIIMTVLYSLEIPSILLSTLIAFALGLSICILYKVFLVKKFGKEERFANSEEVEDIGNLEE